jgi:hypothetical protein
MTYKEAVELTCSQRKAFFFAQAAEWRERNCVANHNCCYQAITLKTPSGGVK